MDQHSRPQAPELRVDRWIGPDGSPLEKPPRLADHPGKWKVIYCFQHWCPGCHRYGLPALQKLVDKFGDDERITFLAIQTVFEGSHTNTFERIVQFPEKRQQ